jgi:hypothetical protein
MKRINIQNPNKLIDLAKSTTIWTIKERTETDEAYVFGLQFDPNKVWDQYQIRILKKTKVITDVYDMVTKHYYVDMICEEVTGKHIGLRKQITNTIPLDDAMRVGKVLAHMLDGVAEIENR